MRGRGDLVFALYSEDARATTTDFAALREILYGMLALLAPGHDPAAIRTEPAQSRERRLSGGEWKAGPGATPMGRRRRALLVNDIRTQIERGYLVFFHVDADAVWSQREQASVRRELERLRRDLARSASGFGEKTIDHWFIPAIPYFEFEAWAFANTSVLLDHLSEGDDLARVDAWLEDLSRLDEIADVKNHLTIEDSLTHELVRRDRGFPCERLAAAGKSYADTVACLRRSPPIRAHFGLPADDA